MSVWVIVAGVAYLSFSLGIIAGCLIMSKQDKISTTAQKESTERSSVNQMKPLEDIGQAMGK